MQNSSNQLVWVQDSDDEVIHLINWFLIIEETDENILLKT